MCRRVHRKIRTFSSRFDDDYPSPSVNHVPTTSHHIRLTIAAIILLLLIYILAFSVFIAITVTIEAFIIRI